MKKKELIDFGFVEIKDDPIMPLQKLNIGKEGMFTDTVDMAIDMSTNTPRPCILIPEGGALILKCKTIEELRFIESMIEGFEAYN